MKTQALALSIILLAGLASATISSAKKADDVTAFIQAQKQTDNVYGLYFFNKDESPIFSAISGLFSPDKEKKFQDYITNNQTFQILKVDTRIAGLDAVATASKIPTFPYAIVFFDKA
jgi:hypothetical protein